MVVGFPATAVWAVFIALFVFIFTWFVLPCMNIMSVGAKMVLPLLRLPMTVVTEIIGPILELIIKILSVLYKK